MSYTRWVRLCETREDDAHQELREQRCGGLGVSVPVCCECSYVVEMCGVDVDA